MKQANDFMKDLLKGLRVPLEQMPVYVRRGARLPVHAAPVRCTDDMAANEATDLIFDETFKGLSSSVLGQVLGL